MSKLLVADGKTPLDEVHCQRTTHKRKLRLASFDADVLDHHLRDALIVGLPVHIKYAAKCPILNLQIPNNPRSSDDAPRKPGRC
jgi:hypothetical protein